MNFEKNIYLYYIIVFLKNFALVLPIYTLFYLENGLTLSQIGFLMAIMSIIGLVLEVPSGIFADFYGKKKSIVIGIFFLTAGSFIKAMSISFGNFIIALTIISGARSLISGADNALLYETLKEIKREKEYKKIAGTANSILLISMGLGSLLGGLLSVYGLRTVHYLFVIPLSISFLISFLLKEPTQYKEIIEKKYFNHLKQGISYSLNHKNIKFFIIFSGFVMSMMLVSHNFVQPYMKQIGLPVTSFGAFFFIFLLISSISSKFAHLIEEKIGQKNSLIIIPLILILQFFLMGNFSFYFGFIFIFLGQFAWGFTTPIINHYINHEIKESNKRSTILSINEMSKHILAAIFSPLLGWFADIWTLQTALIIQASIVFVLSLIIIILWKINKKVY